MLIEFEKENGADVEGLSRDAYSAFWKEFLLSTAVGEDEQATDMCPDYDKEEWKSVGRILLKGFKDTGVYPVDLSMAFSVALKQSYKPELQWFQSRNI